MKEEVSRNSRAIDELQKQCSRNQILTDLEDIKCSIITLQSITDSLFSVVNVEKNDLCLIVETHNTTKNNSNPNRDESLIISECQRIENPFEIRSKGNQKHVDPPIISVCQPVEELCSTANTDVDNRMASELSRLRNENDLLQRNVTVLRDENDLLRDTSEV